MATLKQLKNEIEGMKGQRLKTIKSFEQAIQLGKQSKKWDSQKVKLCKKDLVILENYQVQNDSELEMDHLANFESHEIKAG